MSAFKKASGAGRPSKITPELIASITNAMRAGAYVETAAAIAGIDKSTLYTWLRKGRFKNGKIKLDLYGQFLYAVEKAMAEAEMRDLLNIDKCAMGQEPEYERYPPGSTRYDFGKNAYIDVSGQVMLDQRGNPIRKKLGMMPSWQASAWRLERRNPNRWAKLTKVEASGPGGGPIEQTSVNETPQEREERQKLALELAKKLVMLDNEGT